MKNLKVDGKFSRRQFLKTTGAASTVLGSSGLALFGYQAGKDPQSYTGCENFEGANQTFNRKRWYVNKPHYKKVGPTSRVDARTEVIFYRRNTFRRQYSEQTGLAGLDEYLQDYYSKHSEVLELDKYLLKEILPKQRAERQRYGDKFILATAWSSAIGAVVPTPINQPPEISDFPGTKKLSEQIKPMRMKSPEKTSKLIKKIAHELGSTLVGIAKLNPDWVYAYPLRGRGFDPDKHIEVPKHWKYALVVGAPMSWDPLYASPVYGTSNDAYSRSRIIAFRLASFIKQLGYAARPHTPGLSYDLMTTPVLVDAGLGEQGRHSLVITPELGSNFRPSIITTNLPLEPDKPIEFGVQDFCRDCKICAENCPSGAITMADKVEVRGYLRYQINREECLNFWHSSIGNMGCLLCVASCPYTRKANWLHKTALKVTAIDPTRISHKALIGLQKRLYPAPEPTNYYMPSMGGENASYRKPPWWLRAEDFIDL